MGFWEVTNLLVTLVAKFLEISLEMGNFLYWTFGNKTLFGTFPLNIISSGKLNEKFKTAFLWIRFSYRALEIQSLDYSESIYM